VRLTFIIICILAVVPVPSFAGSNDQLLDCLGALNAITHDINKDKPQLNSDYVRALRGQVLMDGVTNPDPALDTSIIGDPSDVRACLAFTVDKQHLEILLKAYHGQLSNDPVEDLAHCYAVISSLESELVTALGSEIGRQIAMQLGQDLGNAYAFVTRLYREPTVWEIERRATQILADHSTEGLAATQYVCEWYGVPVSAMTAAAYITARASK